ncbi:MAG: hypothetical protein COX62_04200 [Deltaproteobacteria bacterium CG_4_10_14_0_2_um_filter_43_8]|nr:MAG: hypothetical protein COV43_06230 [Deltaproteobacteria bacterium CG11_big_fil_rev_8_21_14_0_20_42_23]PJA20698.1 MAG: hypothetical protein COX62_04200 [Deltaproteobacteria bacterium CG_4_10_14_0_2_um_filter_43_8]PJC64429.1 MAG: hypothetical protein CO021_04305 [Deltaproteobacteria bacterium CG_4_9_14_0_2_um_filter_42_21]
MNHKKTFLLFEEIQKLIHLPSQYRWLLQENNCKVLAQEKMLFLEPARGEERPILSLFAK